MSTPVSPAHCRKPDPSEPWRYVCPECGGQVNGDLKTILYRCMGCDTYHRKRELRDKKLFGGRP